MTIKFQINTHTWLQLPREVRTQLVTMFQIPKHGNSVVHGGTVLADGYTNIDLQAISIEKINGYLGKKYEEIDILKAFNELIIKLTTPPDESKSTDPVTNSGGTGADEKGADGKSTSGIKKNPKDSGDSTPSSTI